MKPIYLPAVVAIAACLGGCPLAAGVGVAAYGHHRDHVNSTCRCPECSASWEGVDTVPIHQPDFDGSRGRNCPGSGSACR